MDFSCAFKPLTRSRSRSEKWATCCSGSRPGRPDRQMSLARDFPSSRPIMAPGGTMRGRGQQKRTSVVHSAGRGLLALAAILALLFNQALLSSTHFANATFAAAACASSLRGSRPPAFQRHRRTGRRRKGAGHRPSPDLPLLPPARLRAPASAGRTARPHRCVGPAFLGRRRPDRHSRRPLPHRPPCARPSTRRLTRRTRKIRHSARLAETWPFVETPT